MTFRLTPPPAVLAPIVREAPSRLDPFRLDGPALVSFSGGRTSAYMLRRILDACGGRLPAGVHAVFANTGKERAETLAFVRDCAERWGVHIVWIERDGAEGFCEVDYERASRNGEPFAELIAERRYLPNAVARFCTSDLKVLPLAAWMRAQGHDTWLNVVGLRRDEARRVAKVRARNATGEQAWESVCPLYDARITKADVAAFWRAQPFDLALQAHEGNCDLCMLKGDRVRARIIRERPELAAWWIEQERLTGGTFVAGDSYAALTERVRRLPLLPVDLDPEMETAIPCACTDRRRVRCRCGARRGQGHALACPVVMERWAA